MSEFGNAFKAARAAGKKTFKHGGKLYTTQTKEEASKASARPAPKPAAATSERPAPSKKESLRGQGLTPPTGGLASILKIKKPQLSSRFSK